MKFKEGDYVIGLGKEGFDLPNGDRFPYSVTTSEAIMVVTGITRKEESRDTICFVRITKIDNDEFTAEMLYSKRNRCEKREEFKELLFKYFRLVTKEEKRKILFEAL